MTTTTAIRPRPVLVTFVVALVVLGAIGWILTGIIAMGAFGGISVAGIVFVLLGLVYLAVAKGLLDGNPLARTVVVVVAVLQIVWAAVSWILTDVQYENGRGSSTGSAVLAIIILVVLFTPKAKEFFHQNPAGNR